MLLLMLMLMLLLMLCYVMLIEIKNKKVSFDNCRKCFRFLGEKDITLPGWILVHDHIVFSGNE